MPLPSAPNATNESIELGKKLYVDTGCVKCHGALGRSDGPSAPTLKDDWGHPIRAANLAQSWTFRGGSSREDIFRTMSTGLNGTPMPSFLDALTPEQRWAIADYIVSLSGSNGPGYTNLVIAKHVQERIDLAKGAASFAAAPAARFPIVGQIMEPGRAFHPPATSVTVQAIYDADSIALLVRWHDMSAQKTGKNGPSLAVPAEEEEEPATGTAAGEGATGGVFGDAEVAPAQAGKAQDPFAEAEPAGDKPSEFSDAVAVQIPSQVPAGARKPYFIFGDAENSVDLWFFDLAGANPLRFTGKGSGDVTPGDLGDLTGVASYDQGEWSVIFKRSLRPDSAAAFSPGTFLPVAFSVWDGSLARAWQQARAHAVVFPLRRARNRAIGRRPDGEDGADHSRHRAGPDRLGAVGVTALATTGRSASRGTRRHQRVSVGYPEHPCTRASTFLSITRTTPTAP